MVNFLRVEGKAGSGYRVVREAQFNGQPSQGLEGAVFAALVRTKNQPKPLKGARVIKVGKLELHVVSSILQIYDRHAKSRSPDSEAFYLGHFLQEGVDTGMLLQYLPMGAHTSAHSHDHSETYIMLTGMANLFLLPENAVAGQFAEEVRLVSRATQRSIVTVSGNHYHPLVALEPSLTLIVAGYGVVHDQVHGTRDNHHNSMPFREFSERFIASCK